MITIARKYIEHCKKPSDINEHLPTLREYASRSSSVVECGVREVVSSYAFADGLRGKSLTMIDIYRSPNIDTFLTEYPYAKFVLGSDLECPLIETDMLFIDTWHVYGHLKRELARWHPYVKKYIVMHDTQVDGVDGETIRLGFNAQIQSIQTGIPVEEINRGLRPAIEEFMAAHPEWKLNAHYTNNNGLTILERVA
jgi:hypothetical protein